MIRPRLIALDLDGTLLDRERAISDRATQAIRALTDAGVLVLLATGRPPRFTRDHVHELGLQDALVYNGASTYHAPTDTSTHHHQLTAEVARRVIERLREGLPGVGLGLETHHGWYLDEDMEAKRRAHPHPLAVSDPDGVGAVETFVRDGVIKIFARHGERSAASMAAALDTLEVYATWSDAGLLEIMHPAVNKQDALARHARAEGIDRAEVAFFGDEENDIQALAWAGHGVAVANANAGARAAADEITASNDEDGVARVLERWLD